MDINQFLELAKAHGTTGLITAVIVLAVIYLAKFGGLIKSGNVARIVNVVLAVIFGGYKFGDEQGAFVAVIASVVSALAFEALTRLSAWLESNKARG